MIIRPLMLRHGRLALPKPPSPPGTLRRAFTTSSSLFQHQPQEEHENITGSLASSASGAPPSEIRDPTDPVAQNWAFFHHQKARTAHIGTSLAPHYKPHELVSNPPGPQDITLELLVASQAHIGHATSLWHPANAKYIFGVRGRDDPIHIISLDITAAYLRRACKIIKGVTSRGGLVLFVGTRDGQARAVVNAAEMAKGCHLFSKWIPGSITNGQQILGACAKKVVDENDVTVHGFGDQLPLTSALKPDLVVCLNPLENYILLHECGLHNIPTIGIVDTDVNPTWLTYPIPANDDSLRCVQVICGALGRAGEEGQKIRMSRARAGVVVSMPSHGLQPPTEGQEERDLEAERRARAAELAMMQEDVDLDAQLFATDPADAAKQDEANMLDEPDFVLEDDISSSDMLDRSLRRQQADGDIEDFNVAAEPYVRDRPLTAQELAQAPPTEGDIEVGPDHDASRDPWR